MNKTALPAVGGGSAGGAGKERSKRLNNLFAPSVQQPPKPHVCRAAAPPLRSYSSDTVTAILELVALHLRRTIPALSDLTLDAFDAALADLRPQLRELLDSDDEE